MPKSTFPAAATGLPADEPDTVLESDTETSAETSEYEIAAQKYKLEASRIFDRRYSDWLAARAAKNLFDDGPDEEYESLSDREDETATRFMTTPAKYGDHVWKKLELLEYYLIKEIKDGPYIEKPCFAYLGAIKADLLELGIG
jgi:hypothetical protein